MFIMELHRKTEGNNQLLRLLLLAKGQKLSLYLIGF